MSRAHIPPLFSRSRPSTLPSNATLSPPFEHVGLRSVQPSSDGCIRTRQCRAPAFCSTLICSVRRFGTSCPHSSSGRWPLALLQCRAALSVHSLQLPTLNSPQTRPLCNLYLPLGRRCESLLMGDLSVESCVPVLVVANEVEAAELKAVRDRSLRLLPLCTQLASTSRSFLLSLDCPYCSLRWT